MREGGRVPVIHHDRQDAFPAWCELESFAIIPINEPGTVTIPRRGRAEKLVLVNGGATLVTPEERDLAPGEVAELPTGQAGDDTAPGFTLRDAQPGTVVVHLAGRWGAETGGCGVFTVARVENPTDKGDPVSYPKETTIDRHYHDCDEYWIVVEGSGTAMSEETLYEVGPGDCLAIGMGHHHDFPLVKEPVRAVYFETTLEGQKRRGHLWEHTHGPAEPRLDRV